MTPQEKSKQLIDKFHHLLKPDTAVLSIRYRATQCATICVEELLQNNFWEGEPSKSNYFEYWQQVLAHLRKND